VKILPYHCNNGRFHNNAFQQACQDARQQLTFCGVNAHFQNGVAKRAIQDLLKSTSKQLLHARAHWPEAIHLALWPYTLHINLPVLEDGTSRLELFSSICVVSNMKYVYTLGYPVFALQNTLASGNQLPCWSPHARLGLNLGPNPMHAMNIYLVLNLVTGCISPQYHCRFDDFFETACHGAPDLSGTICWQQLANLYPAKTTFSKVSTPKQHSIISLETPFEEESHTMSKLVFGPNTYNTTSDLQHLRCGFAGVREHLHFSANLGFSHN
jgi:hypothetical protein